MKEKHFIHLFYFNLGSAIVTACKRLEVTAIRFCISIPLSLRQAMLCRICKLYQVLYTYFLSLPHLPISWPVKSHCTSKIVNCGECMSKTYYWIHMLNAKAKTSLCTSAKESDSISSLGCLSSKAKGSCASENVCDGNFFPNNPVCYITKSLCNASAIPMP